VKLGRRGAGVRAHLVDGRRRRRVRDAAERVQRRGVDDGAAAERPCAALAAREPGEALGDRGASRRRDHERQADLERDVEARAADDDGRVAGEHAVEHGDGAEGAVALVDEPGAAAPADEPREVRLERVHANRLHWRQMASGRVSTWKDMVSVLDGEKVPYEKEEDQQVARIPVKTGPLESYLYLRRERDPLPYVTAVCPLYLDVPAERIPAVEAMCARLNHGIALPGFGFDHDKRFIYYRLTIMLEPSGMDPEFFRKMALACVNNSRDFYLAVRGVVQGDPPENALATAQAQDAAAKAAAAASEYQD
jgi:hypothetical protein